MLLDLGPLETALASLLPSHFPSLHELSIPLHPDTASSFSPTLDPISGAIVSAEDTLRKLYLLRSQLHTLINNTERWQAELLNSQNTAVQLPAEILFCIFEMAVSSTKKPAPRLLLSQICARWRGVSLQFGKLWSSISFPPWFVEEQEQSVLEVDASDFVLAREFMRRSRGCRLDVYLACESWTGSTVVLDAASTARIARLSLPVWANRPSIKFLGNPPTDLDEVTLDGMSIRSPGRVQFPLLNSVVSTRVLTLSRCGVNEADASDFSRLTRLHIHNVDVSKMLQTLNSILAPRLRLLDLRWIDRSHGDGGLTAAPEVTRMNTHSPQYLSLRDMIDPFIVDALVQALQLSKLRVLQFGGELDFEHRSTSATMETQLATMFAACNMLHALSFRSLPTVDVALRALLRKGASIPVPHLEALYIHYDRRDYDLEEPWGVRGLVRQIVQQRVNKGGDGVLPIHRLQISRELLEMGESDSAGGETEASDEDWLRQNVPELIITD